MKAANGTGPSNVVSSGDSMAASVLSWSGMELSVDVSPF